MHRKRRPSAILTGCDICARGKRDVEPMRNCKSQAYYSPIPSIPSSAALTLFFQATRRALPRCYPVSQSHILELSRYMFGNTSRLRAQLQLSCRPACTCEVGLPHARCGVPDKPKRPFETPLPHRPGPHKKPRAVTPAGSMTDQAERLRRPASPMGLDQVLHHSRIGQGRGIAETVQLVAAILRRIRRMILPERVFGRLGAHCR